jgi:hypothetical protein
VQFYLDGLCQNKKKVIIYLTRDFKQLKAGIARQSAYYLEGYVEEVTQEWCRVKIETGTYVIPFTTILLVEEV